MNWYSVAQIYLILIYFLVLTSSIIRRKHLGKNIGFFIAAISMTLFVEISAYFIRTIDRSFIMPMYVIGLFGITMELFIVYFMSLSKSLFWRRIHLLIAVLHVINFFVGALVYEHFFVQLETIPFFIGVFLLVMSIIFFLHEVFNSDEIINFTSYFPFYAAFSLLFIYIGLIPSMLLRNEIKEMDNAHITLAWIRMAVNIIGYPVMLIGVFVARQQKNKLVP